MGRRRTNVDPSQPLPPGLVRKGRQFRARLSCKQPWIYFGRDYPTALQTFGAWKQSQTTSGSVEWLLDHFVGTICPARVTAKRLKERTAGDYLRDSVVLKKGLGKIPLIALDPVYIAQFREARAESAPSHVRNELACLSAALSYAVEIGMIKRNPAREVRRPPKIVRDRLISHDEYVATYNKAHPSVQLAMTLCLRTLASPGDMLKLGPKDVVVDAQGNRILRFRRGKTKVGVDVAIIGELEQALAPLLNNVRAGNVFTMPYRTFVRREDGHPYTASGLASMFRRAVHAANLYEVDRDGKHHVDFGLRDLRAKGATDMFRAGVPIRQIQLLLGHKSVRTTEIYLKQLVSETVRPNETVVLGAVK